MAINTELVLASLAIAVFLPQATVNVHSSVKRFSYMRSTYVQFLRERSITRDPETLTCHTHLVLDYVAVSCMRSSSGPLHGWKHLILSEAPPE